MIEVVGNIWDFDGYIVIPTNGFIKNNGCCVMGRGLAAQCQRKYPPMPKLLGNRILAGGNHVYQFEPIRILTFPVKHKWWETADLQLIERSAMELVTIAKNIKGHRIYLPRVGCGNGNLEWKDVQPILEKILILGRYVVVSQRA